jgi:heterodisulfide reductase subunit A-like polyferredoxin
MEAEVLVVGGGIGGLMGAINAADQGGSVVAEKANTNFGWITVRKENGEPKVECCEKKCELS